MCTWREVHENLGRAPRRNMRKPRRGSSSGREDSPCRLLLAIDERRLQEVCPVLQTMPTTRRLAQGASRGVEVDLQPLAVSYLGNRHPGTFPAGDQADEVLGVSPHAFSPVLCARLPQLPATNASSPPSAPWSWQRRLQQRQVPRAQPDLSDCFSFFS